MTKLLDLQARVRANAAQARDRAAENRAKAPEFAAFLDSVREWAPGTRVRCLRWPDGSIEGTPSPIQWREVPPHPWLPQWKPKTKTGGAA